MTQQELADAAHVDLKTIYNLESGTRWPIAKTRAAVSAALQWEGDALTALADDRQQGADVAAVPAPPADDLAEVRVLLAGLDRAKITARPEFDRIMAIVREFPPGVVIPGAFLFDDPRYQAKWDETLGREYGPGRVYSPARTALVVAVQQFRDQRRAARDDSGQGGGMAAGLSRAP